MIPDRVLKVVWGVATLGVVGVALAVSLDKPWVSPQPPKDAAADAPEASTSIDAAPAAEPILDVDALFDMRADTLGARLTSQTPANGLSGAKP